ncbi:UNVERIFIED_CONTAM: hypothetical protein DV032_16315, partial [Lacticaseibacillus paracasei]|nr:hypothetical protein [Lacticaseibacillus paracasei]
LSSLVPAAVAIITYLMVFALIQKFGIDKALTDPDGLQNYLQSGNRSGSMNTIQSLVNTMLIQGVNFGVLDLVRRKERVQPLHALLGLFNGQWFWGAISLWLFMYFLTLMWLSFFLIPGILLAVGWRQSFWFFKVVYVINLRFSSIS